MKQHEILPFYDEHRFHSGWSHLAALRTFLPELFAARELQGCHYFTSHAVLCLSRFPTYEERHGKPLLSIYSTSLDLLQFEFITFEEQPPVHRSFSERVVCPIAFGLHHFDALYSKFLKAHEPSTGNT